ncbi:MAG: RluA family pseudouridine synthase [Alphaproteobacteria bacterium]
MAEVQKHEAIIDETNADDRLDKAAASIFGHLSRARLKALIEDGAVRLENKIVTSPKLKVRLGQAITLEEPEVADLALQPEHIPLEVHFEDNHLLIINKPAGLVVHPGAGNLSGTLVNALLYHCGASLPGIGGERRPGIVHRLDKDTSGLIVIAKDELSLRGLQKQFQKRTIDRHYAAIVWGLVPTADGSIDAPIGRHPKDRLKMTVRDDGREAVTNFQLVEAFGTFACQLECRLETGRTHQIRVHFDHCGYPLLGDPLYGTPKKRLTADAPKEAIKALSQLPGQALHAAELGFTHPITKERLHFEVSAPREFEALTAGLRKFKTS